MKRLFCALIASVVAAGSLAASSVCVSADINEAGTAGSNINAITTSEPQRVFTDIEPGTTLEAALIKLKAAGIINGYEDGSFLPGGGLSRAEFCKMVNKLFEYTEKAEDNFPDVTEQDWFYTEVQIAKKKGYINGFEDGTFRGREQITREQVCVILNRICNLYKLSEVEITDKVSDWARDSVAAVISNGFMLLEEGNTFRATQIITREEFAYTFIPFLEAINQQKQEQEKEQEQEQQKPDDGKGGNTGGNTGGGNTGGGNTGGGNTGGGNTGGGNTEDKPDPGDDKDDEKDDGDNTGGDKEDNAGDNTGDNKPDPDPEPEPEPDLSEDDIVVEEMRKLYDDLNSRNRFSHAQEFRPFFNNVKAVLKQIIDDSETILITPEYITEQYYDTMNTVKNSYYELCDQCIAEFNGIVNECATKYKAVLLEYFYDIIPEEAFEIIGQ